MDKNKDTFSKIDLNTKEVVPLANEEKSAFLQEAMNELVTLVQDETFACIGAKQVFKRGEVYAAEYEDMESLETAQKIINDIKRYSALVNMPSYKEMDKLKYSTYLSVFKGEDLKDQVTATKKIYTLLKNIISLDKKNSKVADGYSRDPNDRNFAMSVDENPYFTAFFHPLNEDNPRKTENAIAINWNSHYVFDHLKAKGLHPKWEKIIRERMMEKHGNIHGDLLINGTASEILQYNLVKSKYKKDIQKLLKSIFDIPENSHLLEDEGELRNEAHKLEDKVKKDWGNG